MPAWIAWFRRPRQPREWVPWLTTAGLILSIGVLVGVTAALWVIDHEPEPYEPIAFVVPQRIEETTPQGLIRVPTIPGIDGPAVTTSETVPVVSQRCNNDPEPVQVVGSIAWVRLDERGDYVTVADSVSAELQPGCETRTFENPIPDLVIASILEHDHPQVWQIVGSVTPTAPGGVTVNWQTEPFTVVGDGLSPTERLRV